MLNSITVDRSIDTSSFPTIEGKIAFSIVENGEFSNVCRARPEAYVIDTELDWNRITEKITSDCEGNNRNSPLPHVDLIDNTVLAYFWGQKPNLANSFSIIKIEGESNASSAIVTLEFKNGSAKALSYPYIIVSIPKTSYKRFVFEE